MRVRELKRAKAGKNLAILRRPLRAIDRSRCSFSE